MARYDKYDPKNGGYRATLAADYSPTLLEKIIGVGHDANGRLVKGAGVSGITGVLVLTKAYKAGSRVDPMTSGEIIEFGPTVGTPGTDFGTAGTVYYSDTNGDIVAGLDEVQTVTVTGTPTGGTFTLTFDEQTTAAIDFDATAAEVQAALVALSNIGTNDVSVSGDAGGPFTVTFGGTLADSNVAELTATASLTGGTDPDVTVATSTAGGSTTGLVRVGHTVEAYRLIVRVEH